CPVYSKKRVLITNQSCPRCFVRRSEAYLSHGAKPPNQWPTRANYASYFHTPTAPQSSGLSRGR
ncbi:MAG: hypothetical protein, partial [Olavius algarvensis spirochete endosymbiont]